MSTWRWSVRLNVTLYRVPIGYVFIGIITESETYNIYVTVHLII
jgi:hypothetical protein